jgi:glycosyltransferase involved in cell wall biosynthesis
MAGPSRSHLVLIPSFNSGAMVARVALDALDWWRPVWVVIDASTDGSGAEVEALSRSEPGLRVIVLPENAGKGGAVLAGMRAALAEGFTHAVVMDADGQHRSEDLPEFVRLSEANPGAMILGEPIFGSEAPRERVSGRRVGNWWANLETLWGGIRDSLFGYRVYPIGPSVAILESIRTARRFDFDTELAVRLYWAGVRPINLRVPVVYPARSEGGVTHFRYLRDNLLLIGTHARLFFGMLRRLPRLVRLRGERSAA